MNLEKKKKGNVEATSLLSISIIITDANIAFDNYVKQQLQVEKSPERIISSGFPLEINRIHFLKFHILSS